MAVTTRQRVHEFCNRFGLQAPIVQAPMAGASPPELAIAIALAGGMGAAGVLLDRPADIAEWANRFRAATSGAFQLNTWIPGALRDDDDESPNRLEEARNFMGRFGTPGETVGSVPDFGEQCEAMLSVHPTVISSIMGLFEADYVRRMHNQGTAWFACATTLKEALAAQEAGADVIVAQGMEAGGHRGTFDQETAEHTDIGLFALLPWFADHLKVPIVAAGGIADGRGVAAALALGASAVQIGTGLLRCRESNISPQWANVLDGLAPDATVMTRAYTGRLARAAMTPFLSAWAMSDAPNPAPFPEQLRLVSQWRHGSPTTVDPENYWAGQSAALAPKGPAGAAVTRIWREASTLLA
ncbi:NAD(P)H-dependent flavin oxidoreductase [Mycobacterium paraintracellulare]|uniref:NAD(P)H-dependent flavin oxidoreductase n=1 Tax=Mycobacterium paraintracellulare TaxID=1138383 RepID=UPI001915B0FF|nr:nitronate monooxygenase [Mycobacterium paraintracellulare]